MAVQQLTEIRVVKAAVKNFLPTLKRKTLMAVGLLTGKLFVEYKVEPERKVFRVS